MLPPIVQTVLHRCHCSVVQEPASVPADLVAWVEYQGPHCWWPVERLANIRVTQDWATLLFLLGSTTFAGRETDLGIAVLLNPLEHIFPSYCDSRQPCFQLSNDLHPDLLVLNLVYRIQVPAPQLPCQGSLSLHTQLLLPLVGMKNEALLNPGCLESDPPASASHMQG